MDIFGKGEWVRKKNRRGYDIDVFKFEATEVILESIANEISDAGTDIVEEYELSMSYREVELDSIELSTSGIKDIVEEALTHYLKTRKEEAAALA